ncbi:MAG: MMPL family transporter [Lachnospiraceae bacterium]|nr:MMPL family transporter [Lachnospiraceae bacterium]
MLALGKLIAKHKNLILIFFVLLLIPCGIGYMHTRINYDVLSYLPNSLDTVNGQDVMVDEFGMGAFSMVIVEGMSTKETVKLEQEIEKVNHVADVLWYDDLIDTSVPKEMLPEQIRNVFFNEDSTMMVVLFDETTSTDNTMEAVANIRKIVKDNAYISGMSAVVTDIKDLVESEMVIYVVIAVALTLILLLLIMDSFAIPFIFLINIGMAVVYNMGSNMFMDDVSYLTQALAAIMQLACTMDYSIFLLDSYRENKIKYGDDRNRAMAHAISNTFTAVVASSLTTVAGFAALLVMTFQLGANIGIVMMKGVIIGVITCITTLPALILTFEKLIDKTTHKPLLGEMRKTSAFIVKHRWVSVIIALIILVPAFIGSSNYKVYYNIAKSLPKDLPSSIANDKLNDEYDMGCMHMALLKGEMSTKDKNDMMNSMQDVDGVKAVLGINSIVGPAIPSEMIPDSAKEMLKSDDYEIIFISSDLKPATDEMDIQVNSLSEIVKKYSKDSCVIGEAPLMTDLARLSERDHKLVNILSIGAIFLIIMFTFKSISLPAILVALIELAIAINMAIPYFMNQELAFIAPTVIGTIQLGSTVDYAILMTSYYYKNRLTRKMNKKEAIENSHRMSMTSILTSGLCFFGATFGVSVYSNVDIIKQICTLLARGAVISMICVIVILPALLWILDPIIIRTSLDMIKDKVAHRGKDGIKKENVVNEAKV